MSKLKKQSIANQWFLKTFSVLVVVLVILDCILFYMINYYFYNSVEQSLRSEVNIVSTVLVKFYNDTSSNYATEIRNSIEEFDKKEQMELMAISSQGRVVLTSSGFSPDNEYEMPDYELAKSDPDGIGTYIGYLKNDEKYMAITSMINAQASTYSAVRVIVSLKQIDVQIGMIMFAVIIVSAGVILLMLVQGLFFVKSIIIPLRQMGSTARRVAAGDFSMRIPVKKADELGELCRVFNYMADELSNSESIKNDFISSVSHELRTPLTAIKGWSETLSDSLEDKETMQKGMRVITAETERLSNMVEELLDFSRIQNGRFVLQKSNMDIVAELADALIIYDDRAKRENITITYNEPEAFATIYGDRNRIRQVFINIIDNAIKYSDSNGTLDIEVEINETNVVIAIQDSGCGISPADLPKIKNKFYKANHTKRGSGIGLAVADEIIQMHGGQLDITSELGVGTTVKITLPLVVKKAEDTAPIEIKL